MSNAEYITHLEELDRKEGREHARYIDYSAEATARKVSKRLQGQLSCTTEEWLRVRRTSYERYAH